MNETSGFQRSGTQNFFTPCDLPAAALAGVRTRRALALALDFLVVSCLSFVIWLAALVLTFGLSLFILPPLFPLVAFFYNGLTVSGPSMATPGMRLMDLEMRMMDGSRVPFLNAAAHAVLFYFSWLFPAVFLVSLLASDKRCLHDMFAGVIVVRRPFYG
ncbi:MAG: RDD family protein [Methylovirgula sp.]